MSSQNSQSKISDNQSGKIQIQIKLYLILKFVSVDQQKSKADLRRERRAKQEEQRAKKAPNTSGAITKKPLQPEKPISTNFKQEEVKISNESKNKDTVFETAPIKLKLGKKEDTGETLNSKSRLFHHFDEFKRDYSITEKSSLEYSNIHPSFIKLGLQSSHDLISCSNSRCIGFLYALKQFIIDLKIPSNSSKTLPEFIESKLKTNIKYSLKKTKILN